MGIFDAIGGAVNAVSGIVDDLHTSDEERAEAKAKITAIMEESFRKEIEAKERVLVAELSQGDVFTKRARPMVVYCGLFFIFLNHVLAPIVGAMTTFELQGLTLPSEFWWAWSGIVATWSIGRTMEKRGGNKISKLITGG